MAVFIDSDGNPATGDPDMNGAEDVVYSLGGTGYPPFMVTWDGTGYGDEGVWLDTVPFAGGFSAMPDQLGIASA